MDNGDVMILVSLFMIAVMFILTTDFNAGSLFEWMAHNWWFDVSIFMIWAICKTFDIYSTSSTVSA